MKKNQKLIIAIFVAVVLLLGATFYLNKDTMQGRLNKTTTSMEAESTDELKPERSTKMEAESTDELKPIKPGMEAESTDE